MEKKCSEKELGAYNNFDVQNKIKKIFFDKIIYI